MPALARCTALPALPAAAGRCDVPAAVTDFVVRPGLPFGVAIDDTGAIAAASRDLLAESPARA